MPTATSIAAQVTASTRASLGSSSGGGGAAVTTATAAATATTPASKAATASSAPTPNSASALSHLFGPSAGGYIVSQRTVKDRCIAKVLYGNDALLTMVKSAAAASTVADPVLRLPREQATLVVGALTTELSQIVGSNFFVAEASRGASTAGLSTTQYYEHNFPFALVYSRSYDIQKLRVVVGAESLVNAWGADSSADSTATVQSETPPTSNVAADSDSTNNDGNGREKAVAEEEGTDGCASVLASADDSAPRGFPASQISGCSEYLDVLAKEHYSGNVGQQGGSGSTQGDGGGGEDGCGGTGKDTLLGADTEVPVAGVVKFMLPFPP